MNRRSLYGLLALCISTLACVPLIAISWNEFLIIALVFAVLLGPPLYRFVRRIEMALKAAQRKKRINQNKHPGDR